MKQIIFTMLYTFFHLFVYNYKMLKRLWAFYKNEVFVGDVAMRVTKFFVFVLPVFSSSELINFFVIQKSTRAVSRQGDNRLWHWRPSYQFLVSLVLLDLLTSALVFPFIRLPASVVTSLFISFTHWSNFMESFFPTKFRSIAPPIAKEKKIRASTGNFPITISCLSCHDIFRQILKYWS